MSFTRMAAFSIAVVTAGCQGSLGEPGDQEFLDGQTLSQGRGPGEGGAATAGPDGTPSLEETLLGAPRAPLSQTELEAVERAPALAGGCRALAPPAIHRLTPTEYRNSMRALFPSYSGELQFPADQGLAGFDNESDLLHANQVLVQAAAANAVALAKHAATKMDTLVGCQPTTAQEEDQCARDFIEQFGVRALRQPLTDDVADSYHALFVEYRDKIDFEAGIEVTVSAMLQAPELMYRVSPRILEDSALTVNATGFAVANRLAYAMLQAPPDDALLAAAAAGRLNDATGIREELALLELRSQDAIGTVMVDFHRQWLDLDRILDTTWNEKDAQMFPSWSDDMITSVHAESLSFVEEVMVRQEGSLADLLTSRTALLDANMADLYQAGSASGSAVELPSERAGIFSRASFLASHAHERNGSPPLRGIAIMEHMFCMRAGQPPPDADTSNPADAIDASDFTNRELFERRAENAPCNSCHNVINAFAYPLESFDAIGMARTMDNGKPVNTATDLLSTDIDGAYPDWAATAAAMADSDMARTCASDHWFEYSFGRRAGADEGCVVDDLVDGMATGDSFRTIMQRAAMYAAAAEVE